jgi:hypothetical protein
MALRLSLRLYGALAVALLFVASPARAQFTPRTLNDPATGEQFHIEGGFDLWKPSSNMSIQSEALGIVGSQIDFKKDLGMTDTSFHEFRVVLRPARKHKLRFSYIPIEFIQDNGFKIPRDIIFNGQKYASGIPTNSQLLWKAYRFSYEYDFITRNRGFGGFILDAKYTDVTASLETPAINQFIHAKAPIPAIGGIARVYVVPNISITGELTGLKIPDSVSKEYKAHYADLDIYGTLNFTNYIGVQGGYRSLDVGYHVDTDTGSFVLRGIYFGVVARY